MRLGSWAFGRKCRHGYNRAKRDDERRAREKHQQEKHKIEIDQFERRDIVKEYYANIERWNADDSVREPTAECVSGLEIVSVREL